jgi:hypothetical protein
LASGLIKKKELYFKINLILPSWQAHSRDARLIASVDPNPTDGFFKVMVEEAEKTEIKIKVFDYMGNIIKNLSTFNSETAIDAAGLAKGIYYVIIEAGNKTVTKKLIII